MTTKAEQNRTIKSLLVEAREFVEAARAAIQSDRAWVESRPANLLARIDLALSEAEPAAEEPAKPKRRTRRKKSETVNDG